MDNVERINTIAYDSTVTLIDGLHVFQSQAIQLGESWLKTVAESQRAGRDLTKALLKQSLEAQTIWSEYSRETVKDFNGRLPTAFQPKDGQKVAATK